jgi:transcriptional regulator with XRE-family HTH domain
MPVTEVRAMGWTGKSLVDNVLRAMEEHRIQRGKQVRQLREARHWSIETLAHAAGISAKTVARFELGQVENPQHKTIHGLATALELQDADIRGEPPALPTPEQSAQLNHIQAVVEENGELLRQVLRAIDEL